jgi:tRNA(adenine34) deaminase
MFIANDVQAMQLALAQAQIAAAQGEVPVGAVVVKDGHVIASACNAPVASNDPCAHAEILALRAAAQALGNYRLDGCELFVTLEPCAMCASAALQARIQRVVYGAAEPKTGAAGSVLNLFTTPQLNHHTQLLGGVLAKPSAVLLRTFFQQQRQKKSPNTALRDDALRTPEPCFDHLPDAPWPSHYLSHLPSLKGLRLHYLDAAPETPAASNTTTYLCLHGNPAWSSLYHAMVPVFWAAGGRVVAPDLIGFGKSDKPKKADLHSLHWHRQVLLELIAQLDLDNIVLVVPDWSDGLGLALPLAAPERFKGLLVMADSPEMVPFMAQPARLPSAAADALFMAPFPDKGHQAAVRVLPLMAPGLFQGVQAQGVAIAQAAVRYFSA